MEQVPAWLEATINAAGMATVYNADDWLRMGGEPTDEPTITELPH